ncbi:ATP-binding protein [Streptomyces prunicolor]|uniref:ATP-binding protein n=1 Tax=Streptomyces prunicolor TaxID=67348 RepID=UPI0037D4BFAD
MRHRRSLGLRNHGRTRPRRPIAEARHRTRVWVQQHWKLDELGDSVELAVAELCRNAVRHGGGLAGLQLILEASGQFAPPELRVMVMDRAPDQAPELVRGESGRGCIWSRRLSRRWGWHRTGFGGG